MVSMVAGSPELPGDRYSCVRRLGEGGFGVVYEAIDTRFGGRVAVKVLRTERAAAAARFKREFRSLVDVQHANLVQLFELAAHGELLYFSMELVDGVDFLSYVAARSATEAVTAEWPMRAREVRDHRVFPDRLRASLVQLVEAVQALHDARKLHCDVKPTNVLVTTEGRLVLLDFGLIADLDATTRSTLGTPGYMAPEQVAGGELTEATDWYAVGAMLHEALTGALPRTGTPCATTVDELRSLTALCNDLVQPVPEHRPKAPEILERLGASGARPRPRTRLLGRDDELAALRRAWQSVRTEGGARLVRVVGVSGIGKTALVEHMLHELRADGADILTSRCYEQESIPYKALDGAIDALAELLGRTPTVLPGVVARLFPVLRPFVRDDEGSDEVDSQAARRRAFSSLRELLARLSAERPIALFIDDVQWGDADSARLLAELVRPPMAPRMLVLMTHRPIETAHGFLDTLDDQPLGIGDDCIGLAELAEHDAMRLVEDLIGAGSPAIPRIGREAAGNPLFIQQLAAAALDDSLSRSIGLGDVIRGRVGRLHDDAQRLVETIALSAGPIDEAVAITAAGIDPSRARAATHAVRTARLVTARVSNDSTTLEPTHDRVREVVATALPADSARARHLRIADTLLAGTRPDVDAIVHHLRQAGDRDRTRVHALVAAERAEAALAFDRAAEHLALVLELGGDDRGRLLERLGNALSNAGRGAEAAEAFEAAADASDPTSELELRRRAGELTLRSGRIALGWTRMERVLASVGVRPPRTRRGATAIALVRRMQLFARGTSPRLPPASSSDAHAKARLDALWSASTGVSMVNHVVADALGLQHMLEAIAAGDRSHVVRGLGYEAAFEAVIGGAFLRKRCARILDAMDELAAESSDPYDLAWAQMSKGVTSWFLGDWPASWKNCDEAAHTYREHCRGVAWELAICDAYRLPALAYLGELAELSRVVPQAYVGASERGDIYAVNMLRLGQQSMPALVEDRPDAAIDDAQSAVEPFPSDTYLLPHYHHLFAIAQAELYRGNPVAAWEAIERAWPGLRQASLLMVQCLRCEIRHLHARAAIASSEQHDRRQLRRVALREASRIERDRVAPAAPFAAAIRAGVAEDPADKQALLARALDGFRAAHMNLYAHACLDRLGALVGGSEGQSQRQTAAAWFASQQIRNPGRMVAMLLPGT